MSPTQRDRLIEAAVNSVRLQGCTCEPDVHIAGGDGLYSALVAHDAWCPLSPERKAAPPRPKAGVIRV